MISDCCGAENGATSLDGPSWSDIEICPDCREHCEFVDEEEEEHACCQSSENGFACTCYKRGPSFESEDERDERGDYDYHRMKDQMIGDEDILID